jgi:hypothetical protein
MIAATRALAIAALLALSQSPAAAATHHRPAYRPSAPPRITIYPARRPYIDFSRYIDPRTGMYCHNTGWATTCVPPGYYANWQGLDCTAAWPFPTCTRF